MVFSGRRVAEERGDSMTPPRENFATERSRSSLHNFSLPCWKWGEQRQLRRVEVDDDGAVGGHNRVSSRRSQPKPCRVSGFEARKTPESNRKKRSVSERESLETSKSRFQSSPAVSEGGGGGEGIEAVRKKIILDLRTHMDKMKSAVLSDGTDETEPPPTRTEAPAAEEARPWNLRTRRAACKEPNLNGGTAAKTQRIDERKSVSSPAKRSDVGGGDDGEKKPRAKFRIPLYKQEIEEDFIAITGARPPRTLKKRPRNVQRQIDRVLPGLWLSEIKPSMYKVNENADAGKKQ